MRIWLPTLRSGTGADIFSIRLADSLSKAGLEPVLTWHHRAYEFLPEALRFIRRPDSIDLVHANVGYAKAFMATGLPVVVTVHHLVHDPYYFEYTTKAQHFYHRYHLKWREARAVSQASKVIAVSNYVAGTVKSVFGRDDIGVIHNWVNTDRYQPGNHYAFSTERPFRLLWVGNHSLRKGADLIKPLAELLGPKFEIRCTGGLRDQNVLDNSATVKLLGRLSEDELIREYQQCDAVLSLSRYEGFGYTALEGMACGKPVIGFACPGITELVKNDETGILVDTDNLPALESACRNLSCKPDLLNLFSIKSREHVKKNYLESTQVKKYIDIYKAVLASAT